MKEDAQRASSQLNKRGLDRCTTARTRVKLE
uniref:Uncharacterized protein n=1 Tax=Anguilla anguilla TaxID=7936 RepID=A0A0E9PTN0_ANGAN